MTAAPGEAASEDGVRVRFCPSPTGTPHVGLIRAALFNWAYARHTGGRLVFRIEDTDAARDSEDSYLQLLEAMRWLGLDWDEGVEVGGPDGPYRQSQRGPIYREVIDKLVAAGFLYESFSTPAEVEARHTAAGRDVKLGYDNHDRTLTPEQREELVAQGRAPVLRMRMPDADTTFDDLIRGPVTFPAGAVPDFVVVRADGSPLYALVNVIDDALMRITHVLRGEDLLPSTPRQVALWQALTTIGLAAGPPRFGHLPYVTGEGNRKLSKRDPQSNLFHHRDRGLIPEGLLNYLALLGWSIAEDRDVFGMAEMVAAFDLADVTANPARFDQRKADAINAEHVRRLAPEDFRDRLVPYLAGFVASPPTPSQLAVLTAAAPLVQTRMQVLSEAPGLLGFLFTDEITIEDDALASVRADAASAVAVLDAAAETLGHGAWTAAGLEERSRAALIDGLGLKPRVAFGPLRVAVSGRRVSPPLFESMEILGPQRVAARVAALRARLADS